MSFLGGAPKIATSPLSLQGQGFTSPGISGSYSGGNYNIGQSGALSQQVGQLQNTFGQAASAFGGLAGTVQPGFSQFRQAGLADLTNQQSAARSNLQDTLAQRRILGSSFASAQQSQQDAEFAARRDQFIAQSYLQELQASNQLVQEQFQAKTQQFATGINQMNLEAGMAAQLSSQAMSSMTSIAEAQAQLDAQNAQGIGSFFGTLGAAGIGAFGRYAGSAAGSSALTSMFGGGTAAAGAGAGGDVLSSLGAAALIA